MTAALGEPVFHALTLLLRGVLIGFGASAVIVGATQIARTLRLANVSNADDVIRRSGLLIGAGIALLYCALR